MKMIDLGYTNNQYGRLSYRQLGFLFFFWDTRWKSLTSVQRCSRLSRETDVYYVVCVCVWCMSVLCTYVIMLIVVFKRTWHSKR